MSAKAVQGGGRPTEIEEEEVGHVRAAVVSAEYEEVRAHLGRAMRQPFVVPVQPDDTPEERI